MNHKLCTAAFRRFRLIYEGRGTSITDMEQSKYLIAETQEDILDMSTDDEDTSVNNQPQFQTQIVMTTISQQVLLVNRKIHTRQCQMKMFLLIPSIIVVLKEKKKNLMLTKKLLNFIQDLH